MCEVLLRNQRIKLVPIGMTKRIKDIVAIVLKRKQPGATE